MTTLENNIKNLVTISDNDTLILKLKETQKDMRLAKLTVAIMEELENRIGEDAVDAILYAN